MGACGKERALYRCKVRCQAAVGAGGFEFACRQAIEPCSRDTFNLYSLGSLIEVHIFR